MAEPTPAQLLALKLDDNDAGASTVRDYLRRLLAKAWLEEEGFNGKRPWGNSGWQHDVYVPMIKAGMLAGKFDESGYYVMEYDQDAGERLICGAIDAMCRGDA